MLVSGGCGVCLRSRADGRWAGFVLLCRCAALVLLVEFPRVPVIGCRPVRGPLFGASYGVVVLVGCRAGEWECPQDVVAVPDVSVVTELSPVSLGSEVPGEGRLGWFVALG